MTIPDRRKAADDLKATRQERSLSTRGTRRTPIDRRYHEDRRREQAARQERLRTMIENKFRGSSGDDTKIDVGVVGQTLGKIFSKRKGRSSTFPPSGTRSKGGYIGRVQNRFMALAGDVEDRDNTGIEQGGEMKMDAHSEPVAAKAVEVISPPVQVERVQRPQANLAIEEITQRLNNISSPMTYYCPATGEAMSLDFSEIVRGDAGSVTPSGDVSEEEDL